MKTCKQCQKQFPISDKDRSFYKRMEVPEPKNCPDCRLQRRLAFRNERSLYQRKCDLCGESMIAIFPKNTEYTVYCQKCWWSDAWDPMKYGRDFDFEKPFFEQFSELLKDIPLSNLTNQSTSLENSKYVNFTADAKNCYLCFATNWLEDCMYSAYIWESKDTFDCSYSTKLELCYECIDCDRLYNCKFLQNSKNCSDCILGFGLNNCKNCFGCVNLIKKEYNFFNEQLNKEEYERKIKEIISDTARFEEAKNEFMKFSLKFPRKFAHQINCENSSGDSIKNCKNVQNCFEGYGGEDLKWLINFPGNVKDCYDISGCAKLELGIDSHAVFPGYNIKFCNVNLNNGHTVSYSAYTDGGSNLFGCIGTKKAKYCILNKQYSKEEYESLVGRIIEHMLETGEYGEFFPISISPFAYNESMANEYFPMTKEEVLGRGWKWRDPDLKEYKKQTINLPENIKDIPESIIGEILACEKCGKNYKITQKELIFYRSHSIHIPKKCPDCRHKARINLRPPRKLWERNCDKCKTTINTVYSPNRSEIVYCEKCYLDEVY